jgi:hypothetical protein
MFVVISYVFIAYLKAKHSPAVLEAAKEILENFR